MTSVPGDTQPPRAGGDGPVRRVLVKLSVVGAFALAFFLVPTLQGINLVADQSTTDMPSTRAADDIASAEVLQLLDRS